MKSRKPKAQRERVVVAWATLCGSKILRSGFFVDEAEARAFARDCTERDPCGPHRVVRLEGRVKV